MLSPLTFLWLCTGCASVPQLSAHQAPLLGPLFSPRRKAGQASQLALGQKEGEITETLLLRVPPHKEEDKGPSPHLSISWYSSQHLMSIKAGPSMGPGNIWSMVDKAEVLPQGTHTHRAAEARRLLGSPAPDPCRIYSDQKLKSDLFACGLFQQRKYTGQPGLAALTAVSSSPPAVETIYAGELSATHKHVS